MASIKEALYFGITELKPYSPSSYIDAKILLEFATQKQDLLLLPQNSSVSNTEFETFEKLLKRRQKGEPVAYITGFKEFFGLNFKVSKDTLIPRPDSEVLVEEAIKIINQNSITKVIDLCTGSGALIISVLSHIKNIEGYAVDISKEALDVARKNAEMLIPNSKIKFKVTDVLGDDLIVYDGSLVLSNPPYIKTQEIESLDVDVKDFEPKLALDGGADGLIFYRIIAEKCRNAKFIALEIGIGMVESVINIFMKSGFSLISICKDLRGIDRVIIFSS